MGFISSQNLINKIGRKIKKKTKSKNNNNLNLFTMYTLFTACHQFSVHFLLMS